MSMTKRLMFEREERDRFRDALGKIAEEDWRSPEFPFDIDKTDPALLWEWLSAQDVNLYAVEDGAIVDVIHRRLDDCARCGVLFAAWIDVDPDGAETAFMLCSDCWAEKLAE